MRLLKNDSTTPNGHRLFKATLGTLASFIVLLLASSSASAATLNVSGGQLLGASGVDVGGTLYNVEFLDGTCIALYNGCDDVSDFTFQTGAAALMASQALLDQVFLDGADLFDTDPELTVGCTDLRSCAAWTPFTIDGGGDWGGARAVNWDVGSADHVGSSLGLRPRSNFSRLSFNTFAVWAPVPEPGTALLLGLGLLGLSARKRPEG